MKKGFILVTVLALLVMLMPGCAPEGAPAPAPAPTAEWGIIEIRVTDPPPADVTSAVVTLTNIEVHRQGGGWETIDIGEEVTFDLMDVIGVTEVLGNANVTAGSFTQIRMNVSEVYVEFVIDNTTDPVTTDTVMAQVPSDKLRIVKAFEVVGGEKTVLTLDFDGKKSLILPGKDVDTGKEKALFKPVVKLLIEKEEAEGELAEGEAEEELEEEELEEEVEVEFEGTITSLDPLVIAGYTVVLDGAESKGELEVELTAKVEGLLQEDGTVLALKIEVQEEEELEEEEEE